MKILKYCLTTIGLLIANQASADIDFIPNIPTSDVLFQSSPFETAQGLSGNTQQVFGFRAADPVGTEGTRTRGQSFTFATGTGNTYDISTLAVSLADPIGNTSSFRPDGLLSLTVFEWDSGDPDNFNGWLAGNGGDFSTGHTQLFSAAFPILSTDTWTGDDLLEVTFDPAGPQLQLTDGTSYGFLFRYQLSTLVDAAGNPLTGDVTIPFDVRQDLNLNGALLNTDSSSSFANASNGVSTPRDLNFTFTGTEAVPESSSMILLGLGAIGFVSRRRR